MMKRVLACCLALVMMIGVLTLPVEYAQAASTTATVKGGWLRLRAGASYDAVTITSYYTGTVVTVQGSVGKWFYVTAPDGRTGYMHGDYLTINGGGGGSSGGSAGYDNIPATVVSANGKGVRLRTGPSTGYGVLALCPVGTSAVILRRGTSWHYVQIGRRTGYMMSQFLATGNAGGSGSTGSTSKPDTSAGYTAYVTSENGKGVRLRSGAGTGYGVLGLYSVGTKVTVIEHGYSWDYIRIGSRTGYMMNRYLTTSYIPNDTSLQGVTLNASSAEPGTTLWAYVSPSGATVNYEWFNDKGVRLGTRASYTATTGDVDDEIYVRVTGTGRYTGQETSARVKITSDTAKPVNPSPSKIALTGVKLNNTSPSVGQTLIAMATPTGAEANYVWYREDGVKLANGQHYKVQQSDAGFAIYCAAYAIGDYTGSVASSYTARVPAPAPAEEVFRGTVALPATVNVGATLTPGVEANCKDYSVAWYAGNTVLGKGATLAVTADMAGETITCVVGAKNGSGYTGTLKSNGCKVVKPEEPKQDASKPEDSSKDDASKATATDL